MKTKIYIDGSEGTTGLRIMERFEGRDDIELLTIASELRKDTNERKKFINASDITFLCLPDDAAREAVSLAENENVRIIDASTAHRTLPGWTYGFPELNKGQRERIRASKRVAVPGCYASGFIMMVNPLVSKNVIAKDYPVCVTALSGYSGAGKKAIAMYESPDKAQELFAPREYALSQQHKHLKEMKYIAGLEREPLFTPVVDDYYCGMVVSFPIYAHLMQRRMNPEQLRDMFAEYYEGERFIQVMPFGKESEYNGFFAANACAGWDGAQIFVTGNEDRLLVTARFDNLGKGASGAAIQCMNIMTGCDEATGLNL